MNTAIIEIMGWTGTVMYLIAYGMVSAKKVEGDAWLYQGLNFVAGIFLIIYTLYTKAYASTALNVAWVLIAVLTLGRKIWKKNA